MQGAPFGGHDVRNIARLLLVMMIVIGFAAFALGRCTAGI